MLAPLVWLDGITDADRARVGAKAFALARLKRAGLPVPDGFVVPAATEEPPPEELAAACARLGAVAVRSSAAGEDSEDASFAGQYRTELDVRGADDVRAALRRCRAAGAETYAEAVGAPAAGEEVAVLVQRFVEPRHAGVAFTRDPRDPDALVVESHPGRGETLVSGRVTPHRHVVERATGMARGGVGLAADGGLAPDELRAVVALARHAESLFGAPQDVEWAIGSEGAVLLQSRPITVESDTGLDPRIDRLTRANVGEVLPDPVTPLTASTVVAALEHAFQEVMRMGGLGKGGGAPVLVVYRERLYLNLTRSVELATRLPGVGAAEAERLVLGADAAPSRARMGVRDLPRLVVVTARLFALGRRLPAAIARAEDDVGALRTRAAEAERGEADLAGALALFLETGRAVATTHVAVSGASAVKLALLQRMLARWAPADPLARVNRLMAGLDGVESAAPALALEALAEAVRGRGDWRALVADGAAAERLARGEGPADLSAMLAAFLARFGHRAVSEGELAARSWREDPRPVLDALATLVDSPRRAGFTHAAAAERRQAEQGALLVRLSPARRALVRRAIAEARDGVRAREHTKSLAVAMVDAGRRLARTAGARLAAEGRVDQPDDVLFLTVAELVAALAGAAPSRPLVRRRRRRRQRAAGVPAPRLVDLRGGPQAPEGATWRGTGVSAGIGVGPARVVAAGDPLRLEPGEVLVAPVLDAALGPLLASAAGAVAEIGGMLSHGAVVARELGVPCVVDVREATTRIRTGQHVLVDGSTGEVRPWEPPVDETGPVPGLDLLARASPADEAFHVLEPHPLARESVYVNMQDAAAGLVLVASLGARPPGKGEALVALGLPDGRVLFALELGPVQHGPSGVAVGAMETRWAPARLRFDGRLSDHAGDGFPPGPLPLMLAPRTVEAHLDLTFVPTTPAIDFTQGLPEDERQALRPLGAHHVEQSGRWCGRIEVDGRAFDVEGTGSRDHTWGRRDWDAAEWWRLFTARFGDDLAVHALAVSVDGRVVEGGFVWRHGEVERIRRVAFAVRRGPRGASGLDLELGTARGALYVTGQVERTITVPVQLARSLGRQLTGRPWSLLLHENYTRYTCAGREGRGMAEITERP